jgi:lantibiotic modifying enzyme
MGWKVFLPGSFLDAVENKVHEIAHTIEHLEVTDGGLMGGAAGLACFFAFYADMTNSTYHRDLAAEMVELSLNPAAGNLTDMRFSSGLAGIAWATNLLSKSALIDVDATSVFSNLHPYLYHNMMLEIRSGHFDYLHGALGYALYFLRQPKKAKYREYLDELVAALSKLAEINPDGSIKWKSVLDAEKGTLGYNLSLSHGISSIIIILSDILAAGIAVDECQRLITGGLRYLKNQKLDSQKHTSFYPSWAIESMDKPGNSRLAWCYGDIGPGLAFLESACFFRDSDYYAEGMKLLLASAKRRDVEENMVLDAGICHGSSGLALIYNILYQQSNDESFKEAATYWLGVCLGMSVHDHGLAGYKAWYSPEYGGWKNSPGLLDGIAGIGLAMMTFISKRTPDWCDCLLLHPGYHV